MITFLSITTINKFINICGNQIKLAIAFQVKEACKFSLEVDSCQDVGVMDQVAICVRYVRNGIVYERLICMTPIRTTTGKQYFELVKTELNNLGLDLKNIISSAFDGASNMSGKYNGLQAILKEVSPNMIYTHCYAHALNLVMIDSCSSCLEARIFFGCLEKVAVLIGNSYKRMSKWTEHLDQIVDGRAKLRKLQKIGVTRWWAKDKALKTIFDIERYFVLLKTLFNIAYTNEFESKVSFEAQSILQMFLKFDTILTAFIFKTLFKYSTPVSKYLQTISLDYLTAHKMIESLQKKLCNMRKDSISTFDNIFNDALAFATSDNDILSQNKIELEIETKLLCKRQRKIKKLFEESATDESNSAFDNTKHKYRVSVYQVVIDTASTQLNHRFNDSNGIMQDASRRSRRFKSINEDTTIFPQEALKSLAKLSCVEHESLVDQLKSFASTYHNISNNIIYLSKNIPSIIESDSDSESDDEETTVYCTNGENCQKCIPCALKFLKDFNLHSSSYSNLYIAYETLLTVSFTQVSCERSFSKLKMIKNRLRSLIGQDLLESFILINSEVDIISEWNYNDIIDKLADTSIEMKRLLF